MLSGTHGDGVYQSIDNGNTWKKLGSGNNLDSFSNANIFSILKIGKIIIAGTCSFGVYRSADNGLTWKRIRNGLPVGQDDFLCVNSLAQTSTNILAGTDRGLYFSADLGLTWKSTNISGAGFNVNGVAANGAVACAAVTHFTGFNNVYRSTNNGVTWTSVLSLIEDWTCMASDKSNNFYAGTFGGGFRSTDNGVTWTGFGAGFPAGTASLGIGVKGTNVFVGTEDGVYFSNNNGASFTNQSTGLDQGLNGAVQGFGFSSTQVFAGTFRNAVWKRSLADFGITSSFSLIKGNINFYITPDPVVHQGRLSYLVEKPSAVGIYLYNASGNYIKTLEKANKQPGNYQVIINGEDLMSGTYFASIVMDDRHGALKFVVMK